MQGEKGNKGDPGPMGLPVSIRQFKFTDYSFGKRTRQM